MIPSGFRGQLRKYKSTFSAHARYDITSPKRVQWEIEDAVKYLDSIRFTGDLEERVKRARTFLEQAHNNAVVFSRDMMKPDPDDNDLGAISTDDSFWWQQVIGTAEAAMDTIIRYLDGNE